MTTDEERFGDLEQEIQLGLAELRECISRKQPLYVQSAVQKVLKDLDRNDAEELVKEFPTAQRGKYTRQLAAHKTTRNNLAKALSSVSSASASTSTLTAEDTQRERLLRSTGRLDASSARLDNSLRLGQETENTGAAILEDLKKQREQIERTREELDKSEGYVDKSLKTLKEMSRRWF